MESHLFSSVFLLPWNVEFSEKYKLSSKLGSQRKRKFGEIFKARNTQTNETVILKAVRVDTSDPSIANRLRAEASFSFDFEGLPTTIEFEESNSTFFLVRKYVDGIPLDAYWATLKRKQQLPFLKQFLEKLRPIFDHLKEQGVVHCDIKPSNFLIEEVESSFRIHLLDFGLSIRTAETKINQERKLLFPLGYAAPELLLNHLDLVDQRTDIFALGVVFWRLLAGKLPLTHPNPSIFTNLQLTHPLPEHSNISKKMHAVLQKMAAKHTFRVPPNRMNPEEVSSLLKQAMENRYNSINEVIDAIAPIKRRFW